MKNELVLDNYGVQELQAEERMDIDGGSLPWKKIWDYGSKIVTALDIAYYVDEAVQGAKDGWHAKDGWSY